MSKPKFDIYFASNGSVFSDPAKWTKLTNSLLLKAYLNTDNVAKINALMAENNFISTGGDFVYKYGTSVANPDARNPYWVGNYKSTGADDYMGNSFMWLVNHDKGELVDPRRRYYFYRQVSDASSATASELPCKNATKPAHYGNMPFCYLDYGYWGKDMGDNGGIPPDSNKRTAWGVYPFGGRFDDNNFAGVNDQSGEKGVGILPLLTENFVEFMKAEAILRLGAAGDARATLINAVDKNLKFVRGLFPQTSTRAMSDKNITDYKDLVTKLYDAAGSNQDKLRISTREFFIASFGNGIEAYNMYRRTGYPNNLQPMLEPNPGTFPNSIYYPSDYTENNSSAKQKPNMSVKVFWDKSSRVLK